jgi:hypothetical protein
MTGPTVTEIPRAEWSTFFKSFTQIHAGWLCTVEIVGAGAGADGDVQARDLPFSGISGERGPGEPPIRITVADGRGAHISHAIGAPDHVYLLRTVDGADQTLEIASGGVRTRLSFRVAALPETVDGMA